MNRVLWLGSWVSLKVPVLKASASRRQQDQGPAEVARTSSKGLWAPGPLPSLLLAKVNVFASRGFLPLGATLPSPQSHGTNPFRTGDSSSVIHHNPFPLKANFLSCFAIVMGS